MSSFQRVANTFFQVFLLLSINSLSFFNRSDSFMLRVFQNRVLRRIFAPKRDEVTGKWRKLHNENLNDL